uniref:Uncharacterized protein n=1 Tax=Magallana gigas TaxID=29159 RepID=K1RCH1_MAGGI
MAFQYSRFDILKLFMSCMKCLIRGKAQAESDGGFISHKISANTYPQPVPIKVVDVNIPDKDNHVDPNTDLPVYDDYLVSYHGNQPSTLT